MNNFDGIVINYPEICVDNFIKSIIINKTIKIFILTHFHDDHMHGLEDVEFYKHLCKNKENIKFYVSAITHQFIATCDKYKHLEQFCTQLLCDIPLNVQLNANECVTITFYGSGHCPGSVMAFIEGKRGNILFTGDFRLPINSAPRLKFLNKSASQTDEKKQIDYLYIDATFFKQNYKHLPSREESCAELIKFIKKYLNIQDGVGQLKKRPMDFLAEKKFIYLKTSARIGYEYIYQEIYLNFNFKIHVDFTIFQLYDKLPQIQQCLTLDPYETPIHSCVYEMKKRDVKRGVLIKQQPPQQLPQPKRALYNLPCTCADFDHRLSDVQTCKVILSTMWFVDTNYFDKLLVNYIPKVNELEQTAYKPYRHIYRLLYSFHSSFNEIVDFVAGCRPVHIKVIALPESVCERDINEFFYGDAKQAKMTQNKLECFTLHSKLVLRKRKNLLDSCHSGHSSDGSCDGDGDDDDDGFNFGDSIDMKKKKA